MFRIAIIGGENTMNYEMFKEKCIHYLRNKVKDGIIILTTGDEYVTHFAQKYKIDTQFYATKWRKYKNNALKMRNDELLSNTDAIIYFNDGIKDNMHLYNEALHRNIPSRIVNY